MANTDSLKATIRTRSRINSDGCWIWQGKPNSWGYANTYLKMPDGISRTTVAHRASYIAFVGPIPDGLVLDHLCRNTMCVNPAHLEPVTDRQNVLRSPISLATINLAKTHCPHGHPYDDENTGRTINPGGRHTVWRWCRTCKRDRERQRGHRHPVEAKAAQS